MQAALHTGAALSPDVFAAISDPTRRRLLDLLGEGPRPVNELARPFAMSRPAVSQHLRILREAGLVRVRRRGRQHHYRLQARRLREVYDWVSHYERFWRRKLKSLGEYLDRQSRKEKEHSEKPAGKPGPRGVN